MAAPAGAIGDGRLEIRGVGWESGDDRRADRCRASFRSTRPGLLGPGPGSLPPAGDPVLVGDPSGGFLAGNPRFPSYFGMLLDGIQTSYMNGFAYNPPVPVPDEAQIPPASSTRHEVFRQEALAGPASRLGRDGKPAAIASPPEIQAIDPTAFRKDLAALPDPLPRSPLGHDRPAHDVYGQATVPTGDFLAHVGDWSGLPPAETARA